MANELSRRIQISGANGTLTYPEYDSGTVQFNQAVAGDYANTQNVGTSEENLVMPADFTAIGYAYFKNLDGTNYVDVGIDESSAIKAMMRLKAGEEALLPLKSGVTLRAQANTAAVKLFYRILER